MYYWISYPFECTSPAINLSNLTSSNKRPQPRYLHFFLFFNPFNCVGRHVVSLIFKISFQKKLGIGTYTTVYIPTLLCNTEN